ncbi:M56 family metallopeptidase [Mucilaginibacter psychrotolerans]|uniref:M56 family peptidase n=1 Tax=Mucilaginibacter psychrotolerans TaxID=1524096 RepID=A0A4Y8SCS2_9SPHI|nr:M56 family metallopeptidase [Mucilaginibacter psychrotolerans]TFF36712.1 M56 family peptidase [Mucilaginibacter psychrotolerans]
MPTLFVFLFKVNMALLLFCAGYYLVLRHLTFYTLNRVYLITAIIFASIYPKIDLTAFAQRHENIALPVQTVMLNWQAPAAKLVKPLSQPDYWQWAAIAFWAGAALLGIRLFVQLFSLVKLHRRSTAASIMNHDVRLISGEAAPFSFWRSIYVNPANHSASDLKAILLHEQVHVNGWHTLDILLAELSSIFYWFNPGVWLMKKAVRENIEFITDRKILNKGIDTKAYQYSLVNVSFNSSTPGIVNHFNISTIKKRIIMMNAKRSSRVNLTRYAFIVPAVALLLVFSFSNAATVKKNREKAYRAISTTISANFKGIDLKSVVPDLLADNSKKIFGADDSDTSAIDASDGYIFYVNGVKSDSNGPQFSSNTESLYFLNAANAKKYFHAGDGKQNVAFAFTPNSAKGKVMKDKIEQLIAEHKIARNQLNPKALAKINDRIAEFDADQIDVRENFTSTPNKENYSALVRDTSQKFKMVYTVNNISLLDSLNYVLNGKKITIDEFNKIDPNKIVSVTIVSAEAAKTILNDFENMHFKPNSKILLVATSDSDKGRQLADRLNEVRVTGIIVNGKPIKLNSDLRSHQIDSVVIAVTGKPSKKLARVIISGSDNMVYGGLSPREIDSVTVLKGGGTLKLDQLTGNAATLNNVQVRALTLKSADVNQKLNNVQLYGRTIARSPDVAEVRTLQGNIFYSDKNISRISDKLIIIDGKEATEKDLKKLSAFDIDRMSTSSDADTVKKYGSKAKYGVVYIFTKKAK